MRYNSQDELSRRQFMINNAKRLLGVSVAPMLGASLATPAFAEKPSSNSKPAKSVIFLNMQGGMSHMDTFDIKKENTFVNSIQSSISGYKVAEYLPKTAKVLKHCTVINSMTSKIGAHPQGQYLLHKSYLPIGTIVHPSIGAWVSREAGKVNEDLPGYVAINSNAGDTGGGWMGANYSAAIVGNPEEGLKNVKRYNKVSEKDFQQRLKVADALNAKFHQNYATQEVKGYAGLFDEAVRTMNSKDLSAFDLSKESKNIRGTYGNNNFGQGCLLARRLVEVGVRYIEVTHGGWDTHNDNFTGVKGRCADLDNAYAALINDLKSKGLLESTLVVLASEFGRGAVQPQYNNGRSHHAASFTCLMAGGGVNEGMVYGASNQAGLRVEKDPVTIYDFNSTIAYSLGLDAHKEVYSPSKRPFRIAGPEKDKGAPVTEIFS